MYCGGACEWQVFSLCLKMIRTKKFASKPKFRGNKYVCVNKDAGVSEKRQPRSGQSGESICVNITSLHQISVNTEIKVGENNFCKIESNFTYDGNIVVSINLLFSFIQKNIYNCKHWGGNISFLKIPSKWRGIVSSLVTKCCKCRHTSDIMTSKITSSKLCAKNIRLVYVPR
jgi:hypothetical protein